MKIGLCSAGGGVCARPGVLGRLAERAEAAGLESLWVSEHLVLADEHFHETLAAQSGSTVLPGMLRNINHRLHGLRMRDFIDSERVRRTYEQHEAILRALIARDGRLAAALLRAHIWQSFAYVRASFQRLEAQL